MPAKPQGPDPRVQCMMENVFNGLSSKIQNVKEEKMK
jgi:hypothetical protein